MATGREVFVRARQPPGTCRATAWVMPRADKSSFVLDTPRELKLAFTADGKHLAGATSRDLVFWNLATREGRRSSREPIPPAKGAVKTIVNQAGMALSADGKDSRWPATRTS